MKKVIIVLLLAGAVYACNQMQNDEVSAPPSNMSITFCDSANGNTLCSYLPFDVNVQQGFGYTSFLDSAIQPHFDVFSWQTFVALNWPAGSNGQPAGASIGDFPNYQRVWEYYQDPAQVFGNALANTVEPLTMHINAAKQQGLKFLYMDSKAPNALDTVSGFRQADGHPLIDVNLNFVLYEIKMNPTEVTFITTNNLTTKAGIDSFAKKNNGFRLPQSDSANNNPGIIEVKAAWRILDSTKGDDYSRFYTRDAIIFIDGAHVVNNKQLQFKAKVGLVGMHIIRKTAQFPQKMIWSTFEHIDNTPDNPQDAQMNKKRWSFYNPDCLNCIPNDTPAYQQGDNKVYRWDSTAPWGKRYAVKPPSQNNVGPLFGTQALRLYPIYKFTEQVNNAWRAKLKGTVWANYRLIGSQWQKGETVHPDAPAYLANTTLETYIQPTSSCIGCHGGAHVISGKDTVKTDLSFIFTIYAK
ncbi:MAG TPA: hypothetical protein VEB42_13980 [Chitinophagaceae bacterium]|nr:hypothetical protein [Chitinophagaceae bacterium]